MEGLGISSNQFLNPLKVKKVNIGSPKYPKFVNIGDYWDDEIVAKITNLLHEFQDLFPTKFLLNERDFLRPWRNEDTFKILTQNLLSSDHTE